MKLLPLQYMQYIVDLNFNDDMRLIPSKERVSIYLERLVTKFNAVKSPTYWAVMLREVISIANELNISLFDAFEAKDMSTKDVEEIEVKHISLEKAIIIEKEFFSTLYEMRTFYAVWKEEGGSLKSFSGHIATMIMLILQGTAIITPKDPRQIQNKASPKMTFFLYMSALREEMSVDIFHDIKHSNLCKNDLTYANVWQWHSMRGCSVDIGEYENLYSTEHIRKLRAWDEVRFLKENARF